MRRINKLPSKERMIEALDNLSSNIDNLKIIVENYKEPEPEKYKRPCGISLIAEKALREARKDPSWEHTEQKIRWALREENLICQKILTDEGYGNLARLLHKRVAASY